MKRFDSKSGYVHFVFADEDIFFRESLLSLDLNRYLFMELYDPEDKTAKYTSYKYSHVIFIDGDEKRAVLKIFSMDTLKAFMKYKEVKKSIFKSKQQEEYPDNLVGGVKFREEYDNEEITELMKQTVRFLTDEKTAAVVTSFDFFTAIKDRGEILEELINLDRKNYQRDNMLLVKVPTRAEVSKRYFEDRDSIFYTDLIPEMKRVFDGTVKVHVYEKFAEELGDRVTHLNEMDVTICKNMVTRLAMEFPEGNWDEMLINDLASFINYYYYSSQLRREMAKNHSQILPENEYMQYNVVYRYLCNIRKREALVELVRQLRQKGMDEGRLSKEQYLTNYLKHKYEKESNLPFITQNNSMVRKFEKVMDKISQMEECRYEPVYTDTLSILKELRSPVLPENSYGTDTQELSQYLDEAMESENVPYLNKVSAAYRFALCENFYDTEQEKRKKTCYDLHLTIVKLMKEITKLEVLLHTDDMYIEQLKSRVKNTGDKIKMYLKENPQLLVEQDVKEVSAQSMELASMKKEFNNSYNNRKFQEQQKVQKMRTISFYNDSISKLEMQIGAILTGSGIDLSRKIRDAQSMMSDIMLEQQKQTKEFEDVKNNFDLSLSESGDLFIDETQVDRVGESTEEYMDQEGKMDSEKLDNNIFNLLSSL